jgi:hypothetical protein
MPIYVYDCRGCGKRFERFMPLALYRNTVLHECAGLGTKVILPPMIHGDLPAYESPIDGRLIEGRRARQEDLRRNNCRPYETGEKEQNERARVQANERLERRIDETIEQAVLTMPARKRELLEQEVRAGATPVVERSTP